MLYRVLLLLFAVLVWAICYWTGNDSHTVDGIIFFGLVALEALLIFIQERKAPTP
jgi:hypothetical protein